MFRKCLLRPKKRQVLYILMTSLLGILILYCTLGLHLSCRYLFEFIKSKRHYLTKRSSTRLSTFRNSNSVDKNQSFDFEDQNILKTIKDNMDQRLKKEMETSLESRLSKCNDSSTNAVGNISTSSRLFSLKNHLDHGPGGQNKNLMNVSDHSCEPLYPQVILYNRIFKTASTTMTSFLEKCSRELKYGLRKEGTEEWSNEKRSHQILRRILARAKRSKRTRNRLLAVAHFYFRSDSGLKMKHTYINLLREPVERFISHYYYARSSKRLPDKLRALKALGHWNVTLEQCLEKQYEGCKWNTMTRFFCGPEAFCKSGDRKALSRAKYNMLHFYSSIGLVEYLNVFVQVLRKRLPKFIIKPPRTLEKEFVTKGVKKAPISCDVLARVRNVNQADIELYKYAKALFLKQAEQCGVI